MSLLTISRERSSDHRSPRQLVLLICAAQALVQIGAFFWPDLLPRMVALWGLSYSQAGWITAAFYGAYISRCRCWSR